MERSSGPRKNSGGKSISKRVGGAGGCRAPAPGRSRVQGACADARGGGLEARIDLKMTQLRVSLKGVDGNVTSGPSTAPQAGNEIMNQGNEAADKFKSKAEGG